MDTSELYFEEQIEVSYVSGVEEKALLAERAVGGKGTEEREGGVQGNANNLIW